MIRLAIASGIILALTMCASTEDSNVGVDLSDSTLANLPNWTAYYCDTTEKMPDSLPCVETFTRELTRHDNYYVLTERSLENSISAINDTFFITQNGNWYQRHNGSWDLFFSLAAFSSKTTTFIQRNDMGTSNLEEWMPDSQYISNKYGQVYVFKLKFPLSSEPEDVAVHFSPHYGSVHITSKPHVLSISRIDSVK